MSLLSTSSSPPAGFEEMVRNTVFGPENGTQYQQTEISQRLSAQDNPLFLSISRNDKLIAAANLYSRGNPEYLYVRYLNVIPSFHSKQDGEKASGKIGTIKKELLTFFDDISPAVFYAFIDKENIRSAQLAETLGFRKTRKLSTHFFSRLKPRLSSRLSKIDDSEKSWVSKQLDETYQGYNLYSQKWINWNQYYILKEEGEIIAGMHATPVTWRIVNLSGFNGFIIARVFPKLPLFRNIIKPDELKFLAADQVFCAEGKEHLLNELYEAVCAHMGYHLVFTWFDRESGLNDVLKAVKPGFLGLFQGDVPADIIARFNHIDPREFSTNPLYINPLDLT